MIAPLKVLFEDSEIFAVLKPTGIHSISIGPDGGASMAERLLEWAPPLKSVSPNPGDAGLVNRLDFETTGILLGAKDRKTWQALRDLWASGEVSKEYLCLVEGDAPERTFVEGYIGAKGRSSKKVHLWVTEKPRSTYTRSELRKRGFDASTKISLLEVLTDTGARHQVRVHAASTGHTLIGDTTYGSTYSAPQFYLHAGTIRFPHPGTKATMVLTIPPEWRSEDMELQSGISRLCSSHQAKN